MSLSPRLIALLTAPPLLWAGNAVVGRMTVPHVPPLALNALRWALALLVMGALAWRALATPARRADVLRAWRYLALVGLLGTGAYNALQYMALVTSTPINVTLIAASMPVWMMVVGVLGFGEHPRPRQLLGAALSIVGVMVVLGRGELATLMKVHFVQGDLLVIAATICWSLYSWLMVRPPARWLGRPDGSTRLPWSGMEFLLVQTLFGVLWASAAAGVEHGVMARAIEWQPAVLAALAFVALGPSVLAYWCWGTGIALGGPQLGAFFSNLTPLFAALLSTLMLGDVPRPYHGVAFLLIVAGIAVSSRR